MINKRPLKFNLKASTIILLILLPFNAICQNNLKLWYKKPAKVWTEALPIGNGRLGAMVYGGVGQELIPVERGHLMDRWPCPHQC